MNQEVSQESPQANKVPRRSVFLLEATDQRLVIIGRDTNDGPAHARYDKRCKHSFEEGIVVGMMKHGIRMPVEVVKATTSVTLRDGTVVENAWLVNDGRQRTINGREADRRLKEQGLQGLRIPIQAPEVGNDREFAELAAIQNVHRKEESTLGKAERCQWFLKHGYSLDEVATIFLCSGPTITNWVSLLGLRPEIQEEIEAGRMTPSMGYELARKGTKAQEEALNAKKPRAKNSRPKTPGLAVLRQLRMHEKELGPVFLRGILFAMGELQDRNTVPGLTEVMAKIEQAAGTTTKNDQAGATAKKSKKAAAAND